MKPMTKPDSSTVGSIIDFLLSSTDRTAAPTWPPDIFAVAALILQRSGAYHQVIVTWPPSGYKSHGWTTFIGELGKKWVFGGPDKWRCPPQVAKWWKTLCSKYYGTRLVETSAHRELCEILLQLLAVSDEACNGFGVQGGLSYAAVRALGLLAEKDTLCENVDPAKVRVFPKLRTPQTGLTMRSLSHNVALLQGSEIRPKWWPPPIKHHERLTLLLLPWPREIDPSQFEETVSSLNNMPPKYGMFSFEARSVPDIQGRIDQLMSDALAAARKALGEVATLDGVVLPELALTAADFRRASERVLRTGRFLIGGVAEAGRAPNDPGYNSVFIDVPDGTGIRYSAAPQNKHHRWQLDGSQIARYGLAGRLAPDRLWWESTRLDRRTLNFIPMFDWLTMSVLICEDLARPDPVGDLIRAVGPNLVIALLMDAPQEPWRWASRYALALADDPGSSVLTLTSYGMTKLCTGGVNRHKIAMWKDYRDGRPQPINLPDGAEGVVLYIEHEEREEWTADGRGDNAATSYPVLKMAIPVGAGDAVRYPLAAP